MYLCLGLRQNTLAKYTSGYIVGTYIISDCMERQSGEEKKHTITKDVVGFLLGEIVSTKKTRVVYRIGIFWLVSVGISWYLPY
jgi:hypothetical protein